MRTRHLLPALSLLLFATGCPPSPPVDLAGVNGEIHLRSIEVEEGQYLEPEVVAHPADGWRGEGPALAGTTACLEPIHSSQAGQDEVEVDIGAECYETFVDGSVDVAMDGEFVCYILNEGQIDWTFTAQDCPGSVEELGDDSITVQAVTAEALQARFVPWPELQVFHWGWPTTPGEAPDEAEAPYGETLKIAAGQPVRLVSALVETASGDYAAWNNADATLEVTATEGEVELVEAGEQGDLVGLNLADPEDPRNARVRLTEGTRAEAVLSLGDDSWPVAELVAVDPAEATSIELVVAHGILDDVPSGPFAARAYVRDAEGTLIHGAPVDWSVSGLELALEPGTEQTEVWGGPDYVELADECQPPSRRAGEREAVLFASVGNVMTSLELSWTNDDATDEDDEDWVKPSQCVAPVGCSGCEVTGASTPALAWLGALVMLALIRRRSR